MQDTMHPVTTPAIPPLQVGSFSLRSRLVVGTGKYKDFEQTRTAIEASGADAVTVAVRRERLYDAPFYRLVHAEGDALPGFVIDRYADAARGRMGEVAPGRKGLVEVILRPEISWVGPAPDAAALDTLHEASHAACFIANSVRCEVRIEAPSPQGAG